MIVILLALVIVGAVIIHRYIIGKYDTRGPHR
jgi:hypothetical protein